MADYDFRGISQARIENSQVMTMYSKCAHTYDQVNIMASSDTQDLSSLGDEVASSQTIKQTMMSCFPQIR